MKMEFYAYYPNGLQIKNETEFIDFYSKIYYWENRDIDLEEEIKKILVSATLNEKDVITILRWKVGTSQYNEKEFWVKNQYRTIQLKDLCEKLLGNKKDLLNKKSAKSIFEEVQKIDGIGPTYAATLLFFISCGEYPIYDNFADIALAALENKQWGFLSKNKEIRNWDMYQKYISKLHTRFGEKYKTDRSIDCALWAYGHLFNREAKRNHPRAISTIKD